MARKDHFEDLTVEGVVSVSAQSRVEGNWSPDTDDNRDLGSSTQRWRNLYVQGIIGTAGLLTVDSISTTTTLTANNQVVLCSASGAAFDVDLPAAASHTGRQYYIKKTDSSANIVTIDPNGAETIDGNTNWQLTNQYQYAAIVSDGTNWHLVANN